MAAFLFSLLALAGAQEPRLAGGILLSFNPSSRALELRPLAGGGRAALSFAKAPEPFTGLLVRDYTVRRDGRLAVSAAGVLPGQEGTANLILEFDSRDLSRPAAVRNTGAVACYAIEAAGAGLWCLGPDMESLLRGGDYAILYRFEDEKPEPARVLKRGEVPRDSGQSPWAGGAQLLGLEDGGVVAWMPGVERYAVVSGEETRVRELPWKPRRHAVVSVALDSQRRLHALLPLGDEEKLDTPYGLFRLAGGRWVRVGGDRSAPRGARLLGVGHEAAVVVDRQLRILTIPAAAPGS